MLLVTFNQNWADEFDVYGLALVPENQYEQLLNWAKNANYGFGTNEGWEDEDISDGFTSRPVTDSEIKILRSTIFGDANSVGIFPDWQDMLYDMEYNKYSIEQDGGGYQIVFEDTGLMVAFGFGSWDEANEALHRILESKL